MANLSNRMKRVVVFLMFLIGGLSSICLGYSGGDGSASNPYLISSAADWQTLCNTPADANGLSFVLTTDLNLSGVTVSEIGGSAQFTGTLDGQGHTIYGLNFTSVMLYSGLFGSVGTGGVVQNLNVYMPVISGTPAMNQYMAGLAGYNAGTIRNCSVTGGTYTPGYPYMCGGFVGGNSGLIEDCSFLGDTTVAGWYGGGLVGYNWGSIESCNVQGNVTVNSSRGGLLVGESSGSINNCYALGTVTTYGGDCGADCGGLVGDNAGTINGCYAGVNAHAYGSYEYDSSVGGLVGSNWGGSTVSNSYATGNAIAHTYVCKVGGLVGRSSVVNIIHCYSTGQATGGSSLGGLIGQLWSAGTLDDSFWDTTTSGRSTSAAGVGKTTAQMKTLSTFTDAAWDFSTTDGNPADWYMPLNGYPQLRWQSQQVIEVPVAVGLPQADAQSVIITAGLAVGTITNGFDVSVPLGNIISQTPAAGTAVEAGFVVDLVVSQGLTNVPDVAGMLQADAQLAILAAGLAVGTVTNAFDPSVPTGHIISQTPVAGAEVFLGSAVDLVVSMGPSTTIPDVTGLSQADAETAITAAGLTVGVITTTGNISVPAGNVISQSPAGGTIVAMGSAVNLEISLGNQYVGGSGIPSDPYQISSAAGFKQLCDTSADWGKSFILTADIDLNSEVFSKAPITTFSGIFNGNGHSISNFTIAAPDKNIIGLFGRLALNGQIKNLGIVNAAIEGGSQVGGLAGENDHGSITNCSSTGSITGVNTVGGLVGYNYYGTITSCCATGSVSGTTAFVGGLTGDNYAGTLKNCYATGSVYGGGNYVGGLTGRNGDYSSITNCYSTGLVTGYPSSVGGLAGSNSSSIVSCFWDVQTSGRTTSFGGVGKTTAEMKNIATYLNAGWLFLYGNITLGDWIMPDGGYPKLVWQVYAPVTIPNMRGLTEAQARAALETAGLLYRETCSVYDLTLSPGLVSQTFPKSGTPVYAGITPVFILRAKATKYAGGDGVTMPYQIASLDHWFDFMNIPTDWNKSFILTTDLDLAEFAFTQAPVAPDTDSIPNFFSFQGTQFTGVFDGHGHKISNLTIAGNGRDYEGLFGYISTGGQVKNLGVADINIQGGSYVGGLAGYNASGTLTSCYATGAVNGKSGSKQVQGDNGSAYAGGLVGWNGGTINSCYAAVIVNGGNYVGGLIGWNNRLGGIINRSYSTGNINGIMYVGGLVGMSFDTITSSYATGDISGTSYIGGLTGWNNLGKVIRCYSTGKPTGTTYVGGLCGRITTGGNYEDTANFWDAVTSGITASAMGTGKTTAQMKTQATFTDAGWDFTNETANGTNDIWRMCVDGADYPRLNWQSVEGDLQCPNGVGAEDLNYFAGQWLLNNCTSDNNYCGGVDMDASGAVNLVDFSIFAQHWLEQI